MFRYNNSLRQYFEEERRKCTSKTDIFLFFGKFGAYPQRLGLNIFGKFRFDLLLFRFVDKGFHGSNIILNFVILTHSDLAGRSSFLIH